MTNKPPEKNAGDSPEKTPPRPADDPQAAVLYGHAWRGDVAALEEMLANGVSPDLLSQGESALMKAAWRGHADIVRLLLDAGASTEARNKYGNTPLHEAASTGSMKVMEMLIDAGAALSARNGWGLDAAGFALRHEQREAAKYLQLRSLHAIGATPPKPSKPPRPPGR